MSKDVLFPGLSEEDLKIVSDVWRCRESGLKALIRAGKLDPKKDFVGGDFRGWPLTGQDIRGIDFSNSDLRGTGISQAIRDETTILTGAILDDAGGLARYNHAPSGGSPSGWAGERMKIAQVAPLYEAVPPKLYGGTERIVSFLTEALVDLGHEVTLFTSADAKSRAEVVAVRDQAIRLDPAPLKSEVAAHLLMMSEVRKRMNSFDFIHFHTDLIHLPFFESVASRTVTTLHGRLDIKDLADAYRRWPQYPLVSVSDAQRRPFTGVRWAQTVHHGVDSRLFVPVDNPRGDYLAFLGRISPEKRVDRAVAIAREVGMPLRIAAKIEILDEHYYEKIKPILDEPGVEFIGEIGDDQKSGFLGNAAALLFPIDWPEPFGLVMIEAMACGTPVIAWNHGSVPEVIEDGITGFIVTSVDEAVKSIERARHLPRKKIRAVFEERFSATTMAQNYVRLYETLLATASRREAAA